jgi:hypothetical protein
MTATASVAGAWPMKDYKMVQTVWDHVGKNFNSVYKPLGVFGFCAMVTMYLLGMFSSNYNANEEIYRQSMQAQIDATKDNAESFKIQAKASSEIASGMGKVAEVAESLRFTQRVIIEGQNKSEVNDKRQLSYWEETRSWQQDNSSKLGDVVATTKKTHEGNQAWQAANLEKLSDNTKAVKDNGEKIAEGNKAAHAEREGFWLPALKKMDDAAKSDSKREEIQKGILAEQKRRADCEEKHAKDVEELLKGKGK